jgi:hypothetical protein
MVVSALEKSEIKRTLHNVLNPESGPVEKTLLERSEPKAYDILKTIVDIVRNADKGTDIKVMTEEVHTVTEEKVNSGSWDLYAAIGAVKNLVDEKKPYKKQIKGLDKDQQAKVRILHGDAIGAIMAELMESLDRLEVAAGMESRSFINRMKGYYAAKWVARAL